VQTSAAYAAAANDANSIDESRSKSAQSQNSDSIKSSSGPTHHYGAELLGGGGGGKEKTTLSSVRPRPFSLSSRTSFLGPKTWSTKPQASSTITTTIDDVEKSPKLQYKQGTVERRINEFQTTYEKLILVSRAGRKILFNTGAFLRFCGLPASTAEQIDNSVLIKTDLLDVIKGPNGESSAEVKAKITAAMEEGKSCSVRCGFKVEEKKVLFKARSAVGAPTAYGVLHLTPLKDLNEKTTAYVAIFA